MHDLRTQVYRHLQRLSLGVLHAARAPARSSRGSRTTSAACSRWSRRPPTSIVVQRDDGRGDGRRHGPARLAAGAVLARAAAVLRAADAARRRPSGARSRRVASRARWPTSAPSCRSRCRVSGILLGKTMGRTRRAGEPLRQASRATSPTSRCGRGWPAAGGWRRSRRRFAVMPALVYLFAGLAPGRRHLDRHARRLHHAADAAVLPGQSLLSVAVDIQTSRALFERDLRVPGPARWTSSRATGRSRHVQRRRAASSTCGSATATTCRRCRASTSPFPPARAPRSSARPAQARRRSATSPRGCTTPSAAR